MKRILADLAEDAIARLDDIAENRSASRASVLREAVADYITRHTGAATRPPAPLEGFGALQGRLGDGLAYQDSLRGEWD